MSHPFRIFRICAALASLIALFPALGRAGTWVAFQNSYTRGTGSPVTVASTFTLLNPNTQYTLKAYNGGLQNTSTELVSSSVVYVNGVQVLGPNNFNQNVLEVNVPVFPQTTNTLSVQVRGQPGGVLTVQIVGVDNDPPIITAAAGTPPNAAGWYNSPVTVNFNCSDKTSGVASCESPITVSTEGANQVVSGIATDLATNTSRASLTVNLDMTPPTITASINPPPDASGYNSGPVTVTFTCSDNLSGVASCPAPVSVTTEGANQLISGLATDVAGNVGSIGVSINISFSYFKIQSWQTGPNGNAQSPSGKCLDYGPPQPVTGATVFLNDCSAAHAIRVFELPTYTDSNGNSCDYNDQPGKQGNCFAHEVLLFAGNSVIGIQNPGSASQGSTSGGPGTLATTQLTINPGGTLQYATEYHLELQIPVTSPAGALLSHPENQIFRLDGDSIILEGTPASNGLPALRTPCLNTAINTCPSPPGTPPLLVIQVQNAQGASGSPLVAGVRNLSDNEFWDFVPLPGSRPVPSGGFVSVATADELWGQLCANAPTSTCSTPGGLWGTVILVTSPNDDCTQVPGPVLGQTQDLGGCIKLIGYQPIFVPAGVTIRGNRRGTNVGPRLYKYDPNSALVFEINGDYARVSGLRLRGQSRATDQEQPHGNNVSGVAIQVDYPGSPYAPLPFSPTTLTQYIATIDHNEVSDWTTAGIRATSAFSITQEGGPAYCTYPGWMAADGTTAYVCGPENPEAVNNPGVPTPSDPDPNERMPIADDPSTLANLHIARNFIHHNQADNLGYGAIGRAFIEGNLFDWNRHAIASDGEPHQEYRAANNLVLSSSSFGDQDFDMHGTNNGYSGTGGYHVDIVGNTFLTMQRPNYWLRGFPSLKTDFHGNVSLRNEGDSVVLHLCFVVCTGFNVSLSDLINVSSDNQFADSSPPSRDPTGQLGVGDFDGDGDDDLFMSTGAGWYFSPAGKREWRYLNSAPDTIDQLLFGDFDSDGRTDVVGMRNGQLFVSWGGISAFEPFNSTVPANCTMANMAVGDFNGVGRQTDIFCADPTNMTWWISYGGNTQFAMVNGSGFSRSALRFGHFAVCGTGAETDVFSVQSTGWFVSCGATTLWQPLGGSLTNPVDGLLVADFNGDGIADVGMPCNSGGVLGIRASPGWQISDGGTHGWSNCTAFAGPLDSANCASLNVGLFLSSCVTLANGAVGRFSGGPGADILLWNYYNTQGAATLWDFPGGSGTPYQLSASDVDAH